MLAKGVFGSALQGCCKHNSSSFIAEHERKKKKFVFRREAGVGAPHAPPPPLFGDDDQRILKEPRALYLPFGTPDVLSLSVGNIELGHILTMETL